MIYGNLIFHVLYMFQTSWVHEQEGSLYVQFLYGVFFMLKLQ
jgi:hypothetical protein